MASIYDSWNCEVMTTVDLKNELQDQIAQLMNKCRTLIRLIIKSTYLKSYIDRAKVKYNIQRNLSIDCKSRWNSTKFMIENLLKYKPVMIELFSDKHNTLNQDKRHQLLSNLELTSHEWYLLAILDEVLTPFYNATKLISGKQYCTLGTALFSIRKMKTFLEIICDSNICLNTMKSLLNDQLTRYIDNDIDQSELMIHVPAHATIKPPQDSIPH
ncbi:unnamed protein product [Rotaria sp. Silwood2]|nr:unnamed protein product [Rotaria sp. Silwood2]